MRCHALTLLCVIAILPSAARAHVSEQGFVLLLPTDLYILGGCLAVIATILAVSLVPGRILSWLFTPISLRMSNPTDTLREVISLLSLVGLCMLIWLGITGPRDPLTNVLPLMIWTGWWIILVSVIGLFGNIWEFINPWTGFYRLVFGRNRTAPVLSLPDRWDVFPAFVLFLAFFGFLVADPKPDDPDRLAGLVAGYWLFNFAGLSLFGEKVWTTRCDPFAVAFALLSSVSVFGRHRGPAIGCPAWKIAQAPEVSIGMAVFSLSILAAGSFDGLKETFWWMARIGVNPLEFPGRTAVFWSSLGGLLLAVASLCAVFSGVVWAGSRIADTLAPRTAGPGAFRLFCAFAPAVLPIALAYHISHFLVSFLIGGQYLLAAIGDPQAQGANFLGLGTVRVTTGFLNTTESVRLIWLTQAGVVVAGHILSVLVSHHLMLRLYGRNRTAILSQIPMGIFMIFYTWFGLWLLAAPRGV
ncbi:MAG: hypothetical protein AAF408_06425 [Pseudomonadota bacterium]